MSSLPDLVRVLNRIFFAIRFDIASRRLDIRNAPDELSRFLSIEQQTATALEKANIFRGVSGVQSTYGTKVEIRSQVYFIEDEYVINIPEAILSGIAKSIGTISQNNVSLQLGYLGRTFSGLESRLLTDGLATEDNKQIFLDLTAHTIFPPETTGWRITHELLHTLGISEEQENGLDWKVYLQNKELIDSFAHQVRSDTCSVKQTLDSKFQQISAQQHNSMCEFWSIANSLAQKGLTLPENSLYFTDVFVPVFPQNGVPPVDVAGFCIPFA